MFTDPILRLRRSVLPFFKTLYPFLLAGWIVAHSVLVRLTLNSWGQDVQMIISSSPGSYALAVFFFIYLGICTWRTVPWRYGSNVFDTLESHTNRMEPVMAEVALGIWLVRIIRLLASTKYGNRTNFWTFPFSLVGKMFWALILLFVSDPVSSFSSSLFFYIFVLCLWSCLNFVFVFIFYIICLLPQQNSRSYRLSVTVPYSVKPFFFFLHLPASILLLPMFPTWGYSNSFSWLVVQKLTFLPLSCPLLLTLSISLDSHVSDLFSVSPFQSLKDERHTII